MNKKFRFVFTEAKKYNPATRQVDIIAVDEKAATNLLTQAFDSFHFIPKLGVSIPTGKHITINSTEALN